MTSEIILHLMTNLHFHNHYCCLEYICLNYSFFCLTIRGIVVYQSGGGQIIIIQIKSQQGLRGSGLILGFNHRQTKQRIRPLEGLILYPYKSLFLCKIRNDYLFFNVFFQSPIDFSKIVLFFSLFSFVTLEVLFIICILFSYSLLNYGIDENGEILQICGPKIQFSEIMLKYCYFCVQKTGNNLDYQPQ